MDIADKKRDRDRDRAATGLGGNFSAALVSRYLLAVFAAFVLADAAISTTLPRYAHARREESSDGPAQRRCQFGTQARIADLLSNVRPPPVPVPVPDALMRWSRALTVRVTWLRSPTSSKPWASTSLSRPVPGTCAPTSLAATRNRLQSNSLTAVTLDGAVAVWSASCTATGASRRSAVASCVSRRWFADLHPQLWAMVRMSGTAAGCYLAYRSHMTSPVRSPVLCDTLRTRSCACTRRLFSVSPLLCSFAIMQEQSLWQRPVRTRVSGCHAHPDRIHTTVPFLNAASTGRW